MYKNRGKGLPLFFEWMVKKMAEEFEKKQYHNLIDNIISAFEEKDAFQVNHSKRVSDMVQKVCSFLELSEREKEEIHMAAHVHDIGMIGLPSYVLNNIKNKTGAIPEMLKLHTITGAEIVRGEKDLDPISDIILYHHENWDGSGYPFGIAKEEIPLGSRIIAICDYIDEIMLSEKSGAEEICKEKLKKEKSIFFDETLTELILNHWNNIVSDRFYHKNNEQKME